MGVDKNSSQKIKLDLYPKFTTKDSHTSLPRSVVTADLPTLVTNPKRSQSGSTTQEAKDLAVLRKPWRTVREDRADSPRPSGGRSVKRNRTTSSAPRNSDGPYPTRGRSAAIGRTVRQTPSGQKQLDKRIEMKTLKNTSRTRITLGERLHADCPRPIGGLSTRHEQSSPSSKPRAQPLLPIHGSPKRLELFWKDLGKM
jgi:hypothetical protein